MIYNSILCWTVFGLRTALIRAMSRYKKAVEGRPGSLHDSQSKLSPHRNTERPRPIQIYNIIPINRNQNVGTYRGNCWSEQQTCYTHGRAPAGGRPTGRD